MKNVISNLYLVLKCGYMRLIGIFGFLLAGLAIVFCPGLVLGQTKQTSELTLGQALKLAEKNSPFLKAVVLRQNEEREFSRAADSGFFPSLGVDAVDSGGFPGSSSGFGTSGLNSFPGMVASPYRKGLAASAYAKWDLWDLSVWHQSSAAHYAYQASGERTKFQMEVVDQQVVNAFLEAVRLRGDREAWQKLVDVLIGIRDTVKRFVRNGQYSEVQGLLIEDQLADAELRTEDFNRQYQAGLEKLALLAGTDPNQTSCPSPADLPIAYERELDNLGKSPLITQAELETKSAEETAEKYSAENLPVLEVAGSAGYLSDTRLEGPQDYSVFVGVSLPLFEGFRIDAEEKAARSEADARKAEISADQLSLDQLNVQYADEVQRSLEELKILGDEQERTAKAVALSKQRYLSFLGPLSDLQQALKDMVNLDIQASYAKTRLWAAITNRYLLNGGTSDAIK